MAKKRKDHWGDENGKWEKNFSSKRSPYEREKSNKDVPRKPKKNKEEKEPTTYRQVQRKDNYKRTKEDEGYKNKKKPKWKDED